MENNDEYEDYNEDYNDEYNDEYNDDEINENKIEEPEDDYFKEQLNIIQNSNNKIQDLNNLIEIDKLNYPQGSKWSYKCYENLCIIYKEMKDINNFILCFQNLMKIYERMDKIIIENLFYKILNISSISDFDLDTSPFQNTIINKMLEIIKKNNYNKAYNDLKSLILKIKNYSFKNDIVNIFKEKISDINQNIFSIKYSYDYVKILKSGMMLKISSNGLYFYDVKNNLLYEKEFPMNIIPFNVEVMENGDIIVLYIWYLFHTTLDMIILRDDKFQIMNLTNSFNNRKLIEYDNYKGKILIKEIKNQNKFILINPLSLMIIFSLHGKQYLIETILKNTSIFPFYEELNNYSLIVEWNIIGRLTIKKLNKNEYNCLEQKNILIQKDLTESHNLIFRNIEMFKENYLIVNLCNEIFFILLNNYEIVKRITLSDNIYCIQKIDNIIVVLNSKLNVITLKYNNEFEIEKICDLKEEYYEGSYSCSFFNSNQFNFNCVREYQVDNHSLFAEYKTIYFKLDVD